MHTFEEFGLKSFAKCIHWCPHHLGQGVTSLSSEFFYALYSHSLSTADQIVFVRECPINGITQYILFRDWLLSPSVFLRFICVACFSNLFLFLSSISLYEYTIFLFIYLLMDTWAVSSFWLLIKLLCAFV